MNRFEHLEDLSEAKQALKENHKINPLHWQTSFYMAFVFARLGQISKAQEMASKTLENEVYEKDDLWYRISLSQLDFELAFQQKQWSQAILASKKTLGMRPQSHYWRIARNLIDLGDALIGRNEPGDLETARETYQQSLDMFTEMGAPGYIKVLEERLGNM